MSRKMDSPQNPRGGLNAEKLLQTLIEEVLISGKTGKIPDLCTHRGHLFLPGARRIYSSLLIEEVFSEGIRNAKQLGIDLSRTETVEVWGGEKVFDYPTDQSQESAVALLRIPDGDRFCEGVLIIRSIGGRIQSIRFGSNFEPVLTSYPSVLTSAAEISVSSIPIFQPRYLPEALPSEIAGAIEQYSALIAGHPAGQHISFASDEDSDILLRRVPGPFYLDQMLGSRKSEEKTRLALSWYKGIHLPVPEYIDPHFSPAEELTIGGFSILEVDYGRIEEKKLFYDRRVLRDRLENPYIIEDAGEDMDLHGEESTYN